MNARILLLACLLLPGGHAFAQSPSCTVNGLSAPTQKAVDGKTVFVRQLATVLDPAVDDYGINADGDSLEIFCVTKKAKDPRGEIAMCLSKEFCTWR